MRQRRVEQCDKFAAACIAGGRFSGWFPERVGRSSARRGGFEKFHEGFARCKRLQDSPVFFMRRRLNGKEGKVYGERNKERRQNDYVGGASTTAWSS